MRRSNLWEAIRLPTEEVPDYLERKMKRRGYAVLRGGNDWLVCVPPGPTPPIALVSHMDTIHRKNKDDLVIALDGNTLWNKSGVLGADDRAGVFGILELVNAGHRPLVIFCNEEERGCVGARALVKSGALNQFVPSLRLLIELDRKGSVDFVYYSHMLHEEIKTVVKSVGFVEASGSFSDVAVITEETKVPHVNVSVGYYGQHTPSERLELPELATAICMVANLLNKHAEIPMLRIPEEVRTYLSPVAPYRGRRAEIWSDSITDRSICSFKAYKQKALIKEPTDIDQEVYEKFFGLEPDDIKVYTGSDWEMKCDICLCNMTYEEFHEDVEFGDRNILCKICRMRRVARLKGDGTCLV